MNASHLDFVLELTRLINRFSGENGSNTPDVFLADFLASCLQAFDQTVIKRGNFYGHLDKPGQPKRYTLAEVEAAWLRARERNEAGEFGLGDLTDELGEAPENPGPTADAYERACAALEKHRKRAEAAESLLRQCVDALDEASTAMADAGLRVADYVWTESEDDKLKRAAWKAVVDRQRRADATARSALAAARAHLEGKP